MKASSHNLDCLRIDFDVPGLVANTVNDVDALRAGGLGAEVLSVAPAAASTVGTFLGARTSFGDVAPAAVSRSAAPWRPSSVAIAGDKQTCPYRRVSPNL